MHYNTGSSLPVSATQPNQSMFISGLPQNVPFQPDVQVGPQATQLIFPCTGYFLMELQNNSSKNPARTFLFNLLSVNSYRNSDFSEALATVVEYADLLVAMHRMNPEQACQKAAQEVATMLTSIHVLNFEELAKMAPQQVNQAASGWVRRFNELRAEIGRYYSQISQPQQQAWGGQGNMGWQQPQQQAWGGQGNMGWQQPQNSWQQPQQQPWGAPQQQPWGGPQQQRPGYGAGGYGGSGMNRPGMGGDMFGGGGMSRPGVNVEADRREFGATLKPKTNPQANQPQQQTNRPGHNASSLSEMASRASTRESFVESQVNEMMGADEPAVSERKYDLTTHGDSYAVPIHLTDLKPTFSLQRPYRMAFDTRTHAKFLVKDTVAGDVLEKVMEYDGEDMDYLSHELHPNVTGPVAAKGETIVPNWAPAYDDEEREEVEEEEGVDLSSEIITVNDGILAYNERHAYVEACKHVIATDPEKAHKMNEKILEYRYTKVQPVFEFTNAEAVKEYFDEVSIIRNLDAFVKYLAKLVDNEEFPTRILSIIVKNATDRLNRMLVKGMGLSWTVDNIVDDWFDLKSEFTNEFGEAQGSQLLRTLEEEGARPVIGATKLMSDEERTKYIERNKLNQSEYKDKLDNLFLIGEVDYTARLPWRAIDMSLHLDEGGSVVLESKLPELFKAIKGIYSRAGTHGKVDAVTLLTKDNVKLEVDIGILGKDFYILSLG